MEDTENLLYWIKERLSILEKKNAGLPKPWTEDKILQHYRFCNVHREDDTVTKWIKTHWRDNELATPHALPMIIARTVNWPDTLEAIGYPYDPKYWKEYARVEMKKRREAKAKVWTGAYLISTNGNRIDKIDYIIDKVWTPFIEQGREPVVGETLDQYWKYLRYFDGMGSFIAAQVVCDLKYCDKNLMKASNWWNWAALGPGSIRGLHRFFGRDHTESLNQTQGGDELIHIRGIVQRELKIEIHAQDIQNCMCEYDKFMRVKLGQGKPRSGYPGSC